MFLLAILLGLYGYGIFILGIVGLLNPFALGVWTLLCVLGGMWYGRRTMPFHLRIPKDIISIFSLVLLSVLAGVNLLGALAPELSFDALWYHLTLPKLYLQEERMAFFPGGLLYYSAMPKLGELFFIPAIAFGNETMAKLIQFSFGLMTLVVIYKIARKFISVPLSLLACLVFYSNIVVAWESTIAYIDLIRAFFESMALLAFVQWSSTQQRKWLYMIGILSGLAVSTKLLALGTIGIFSILIWIVLVTKKESFQNVLKTLGMYWSIVFAFCLPWFLFSFVHTGNIVYPFFTQIYAVTIGQSGIPFWKDIITIFLFSDDPLSPIYLISLPLLVVYFSTLKFEAKLIGYYCIGALFLWYVTPRTGGGRFLLPYLPAMSILVVVLLEKVVKKTIVYKTLLVSIFFLALVTIGYRGLATRIYLPVLFGSQSKDDFLSKNLNFSYGDFYDTDNYFQTHLQPTDKVLLYGFHNLYYVNFPFIDSSYVKIGDTFTHIATQHTALPKRFSNWKVVYENPETFVTLYKNGEKEWIY